MQKNSQTVTIGDQFLSHQQNSMITTQSPAVTTFNFAKIEGAGFNKGSMKLVNPITRVHFRSGSTLCDELGVAVNATVR
jgi:hypothetical protein